MNRPEIILAPGPTPIPPEVSLAQGSPLVYHRGPGFGALMRDVTARLRELYRARDARIFLLTSSGTGGLESAIQNCFSPGDEVFVPRTDAAGTRRRYESRGCRRAKRVARREPVRA